MQNFWLKLLISIGGIALIIAHLIWPNLQIDIVTLGLLVVVILPWLSSLIKSTEFPDGTQNTRRSRQWIKEGYTAVVVFLLIFAALVALRFVLPTGTLDNIEWLLLVALIAVFPLILPPFLTYVRPGLTGIKIASLLELSFQEIQAESTGLRELAEQLNAALNVSQMQAVEYAGSMTSYSNVIIEKVKEIADKKLEIVVLDLQSGGKWLFPNLHFLTLLLEHRTNVRQLVFTEVGGGRDKLFIGMCTPRNLLTSFALELPNLAKAAEATEYRYGALNNSLGMQFFEALRQALSTDPRAEEYKRWSTSASLIPVLGNALDRNVVEWQGRITPDNCRYILSYPQQYIAAVEHGLYLFTLDQQRIALAVARRVAQDKAK